MKNIFRALTKEDVEVRVQSVNKNGFVLLIYKNARVDQNILDDTFGAFGWQNKYEEYKGNLYCSIGIKSESGEWIWKSNCGTESNTEKEKGEASDAFKRAGFNWGIGRELYTAPRIKVKDHVAVDKDGKMQSEYYDYDVICLETEELPIRHITALTIIGKSMEDGYHEDIIFSWTEKKAGGANKAAEKTIPAPAQKPKQAEPKNEITLADAKAYKWAKGKYLGISLFDTPTDYLDWYIREGYDEKVKKLCGLAIDEILADELTEKDTANLPWN